MSDIKLNFLGIDQGCDISIVDGDIELDTTLTTPVLVSLLSDRLATVDDTLPDPANGDRRGWWGDSFGEVGDQIGSRLWLLGAEKQLPGPLNMARTMAAEALRWLSADGYTNSVMVDAQIPTDKNTGTRRDGVLGLSVSIKDKQQDLRVTAETPVTL